MSTDVVCWFWQRQEFSEQRGDWQTGASLDIPGADLLGQDAAVSSMQTTALGEPPGGFEVLSTYDSRPIAAYDFNFSGSSNVTLNEPWSFQFDVPNGYRAVPREWDVIFDVPFAQPSGNSTASLQQNGAAVPNNIDIVIGAGTGARPIKSFFVCEENTTFGISGEVTSANGTATTTMSVSVYGNLIPVSQVSLQLAIATPLNTLTNKLLGS